LGNRGKGKLVTRGAHEGKKKEGDMGRPEEELHGE